MTTRYAEKLAAVASKKRKAELQAIAIDAREKTRQRQATLSEPTDGAGVVNWTRREVANSAWARCAYEDRLSFALFDSDAIKGAVKASPRAVSVERP